MAEIREIAEEVERYTRSTVLKYINAKHTTMTGRELRAVMTQWIKKYELWSDDLYEQPSYASNVLRELIERNLASLRTFLKKDNDEITLFFERAPAKQKDKFWKFLALVFDKTRLSAADIAKLKKPKPLTPYEVSGYINVVDEADLPEPEPKKPVQRLSNSRKPVWRKPDEAQSPMRPKPTPPTIEPPDEDEKRDWWHREDKDEEEDDDEQDKDTDTGAEEDAPGPRGGGPNTDLYNAFTEMVRPKNDALVEITTRRQDESIPLDREQLSRDLEYDLNEKIEKRERDANNRRRHQERIRAVLANANDMLNGLEKTLADFEDINLSFFNDAIQKNYEQLEDYRSSIDQIAPSRIKESVQRFTSILEDILGKGVVLMALIGQSGVSRDLNSSFTDSWLDAQKGIKDFLRKKNAYPMDSLVELKRAFVSKIMEDVDGVIAAVRPIFKGSIYLRSKLAERIEDLKGFIEIVGDDRHRSHQEVLQKLPTDYNSNTDIREHIESAIDMLKGRKSIKKYMRLKRASDILRSRLG